MLLLTDAAAKGQLISECPFGRKTSSKIPTKLLPDFCPEIFVASWGLPGSFLSFLGDLVSNIINNEAYRKLQKISGQKSGNNFIGILEEVFGPKGRFHESFIKMLLPLERYEEYTFRMDFRSANSKSIKKDS